MAETGYLLIADITGYTQFLTGSEVEHAEDIIHELMQMLVGHTNPPLTIAKLEGDAIFSYAPTAGYTSGQTLLETLETIYCAFRRRLDVMRVNTTCTCRACSNIPNLDLKFFLHFGRFSLQQIAGRGELSGPDVILVHRLLKNHVSEQHGLSAYALITQAAVDAMQAGEIVETMIRHTESYENFPEVVAYLDDLHAVWEYDKQHNRVEVAPEEAGYRLEVDIPFPPPVVWEYLTAGQHMPRWMNLESMTNSGLANGRVGVGTVQHCAHGEGTLDLSITGWYPFDSLTRDMALPVPGIVTRSTTYLHPTEGGTRIENLYGWAPQTRGLKRLIGRLMMAPMMGKFLAETRESLEKMARIIQEDLEAGKVEIPAGVAISEDAIQAAAGESIPAAPG